MTETERESLYWRVAISLMLLSPALGYWFGLNVRGLTYRQDLFLVFLLASLPAAFAFELLGCLIHGRHMSVRFWVNQPSATVEGSVSKPVADALTEVRSRLARLSFQVREPGDGTLEFAKSQAPQVHHFLDNAFSGQVRIDSDAWGSHVRVSVTLKTLVLLETDEGESIRRLAEFLGLISDVDSAPSVTLVTYLGMLVAFTSAVLMAGSHSYPRQVSALVTSGSAAALGLLTFAFFYTLKHRSRLFGIRLIVSGMCLASVPLAVGAFRMFTNN